MRSAMGYIRRAVGLLPWYFSLSVVVAVPFTAIAIMSALSGHVDWAAFQITVPVLLVAVSTLTATLPSPAQIWIDRQHELGIDDVIFYMSDEPGFNQVPRDILFQGHIAVANAGGRKCVLSSLRLEGVVDDNGQPVRVPGLQPPVAARRVQQGSGWRIEDNVMHKHNYLELIPGPFVLEPDEVITMQLRVRPGIDWSAKWTADSLRDAWVDLERQIRAVTVTATYRQGKRIRTDRITVKGLSVLQQDVYRDRLHVLTNGFSIRPAIPEKTITD
jgi:hypothetical protein